MSRDERGFIMGIQDPPIKYTISPRRRERSYIWIPQEQNSKYKIKIDSVDQRTKVLNASFTKIICPSIGSFSILLDNNNEEFTEKYVGGEEVELQYDYSAGTTKRFLGLIESIEHIYGGNGYTLLLKGSHVSGELLDITVTATYDGNTTADAILKDLVDKHLTGFTYTNVATFTEKPILNWQNKNFWGAVKDLIDKINADCYVDDNKDFHLFKQNSIENNNEAIVWNDTLINITGLGTDRRDVKNKIKVYGEDDTGLPIIYTATDSTSQATYNVKERIIKDTKITTEEYAQDTGEGEIALEKDPDEKGKANSWMLQSLSPGDKIWITNPPQKIQGQFRITKFTHTFPNEKTNCVIERERTVAGLFRERTIATDALRDIKNQFDLDFSYNFTFDDNSKIDTEASTNNIQVSSGNLSISSGSTGTMVSKTKSISSNVTQAHLKIIGTGLSAVTYAIRSDIAAVWQVVNLEELITIDNPGKTLQIRVIINDTGTLIDSIAVLYK